VSTHSSDQNLHTATQLLGAYLRATRQSMGLSLRAVEDKTARAVTNGYLSQIESGAVTKPSPNILWALADAYGVDYGDLLVRAGHRVPHSEETNKRAILAGFPLDAVEELTESERAELLQYIAFLRSRRSS